MQLDPPLDPLLAERCTRLQEWQHEVLEAQNAAELDHLVRKYLATWTEPEIAHLPEACWPGPAVEREKIRESAVSLIRAQAVADDKGRLLLSVLSDFLATAAVRLGQLGM